MSTNIGDKTTIAGVGQTKMGTHPGRSHFSLVAEAAKLAIEDAGLKHDEVDGVLTLAPNSEPIYTHHTYLAQWLGINERFGTTMSNGGATCSAMVMVAAMAVEAGLCNAVVCAFADNPNSGRGRRTGGAQSEGQFGPEFGFFAPASIHALAARRHMHEYGTTQEQLGSIAVQFRKHAARNPMAQMQKPITLEDYLNSRWVVDPFKLLDCCLVSDGGGAVVVTSAERARSLRHPPAYIRGFGQGHNTKGFFAENNMVELGAREAAATAFKMAGLEPKDIDTAQLYDCFTIVPLITLEDYGFCQKGEGGAFFASGAADIDGGRLPINTAGGNLSEGYGEGMLHITEAVRQLRHAHPPERQVKDCETAIVSGHGGNTICHSTLILRR